jgi:hypothetical protein
MSGSSVRDEPLDVKIEKTDYRKGKGEEEEGRGSHVLRFPAKPT